MLVTQDPEAPIRLFIDYIVKNKLIVKINTIS